MQKATFGAGCFWGIEASFQKIKGVTSTTVGYMGGKIKNPTYEQVCTDKTGYAEVVQIIYDPLIVSFEKLLEIFWSIHDPTQLNRQGLDIGTQYRSVIFYHSEEQKQIAELSKQKQLHSHKKEITTEITPVKEFYPAEEYHQRYLEKNRLFSCKK
ncbi:MAG: peptide-methionine (S)-S-oxide reductase MsrA [Candidatus Thermoplasmatota archaeon]|nr:peptide-methionine (S)-S-oxide reductase MsrA [Candidatus Thermoplasmatota archaeon]